MAPGRNDLSRVQTEKSPASWAEAGLTFSGWIEHYIDPRQLYLLQHGCKPKVVPLVNKLNLSGISDAQR